MVAAASIDGFKRGVRMSLLVYDSYREPLGSVAGCGWCLTCGFPCGKQDARLGEPLE